MALYFSFQIILIRFCSLLKVLFEFLFNKKLVPKSVNYHFTRKCNYECGFCFHTAKNSFVLPLDEAKTGLKLLKDAGKKLKLIMLG